MDIASLFDHYSLRARLKPALLTLFPAVVTFAVWLPEQYQVAAGFMGLAATCGVTLLLADVARKRGRDMEARLFSDWGGKPTTLWLRHTTNYLDPYTKQRYHDFLAANIPRWNAPTLQDERQNSADADARYDAAVRWLLEFTRDRTRFPLVFKENVSYGRCRNSLGLKPIGLSIAVLCIAANAAAIWHRYEDTAQGYEAGIAAVLLSLIALFVWVIFVSKSAVRDAGEAYARALLSACDANPGR